MRRQVEVVSHRESVRALQPCEPAAAGDVGLQVRDRADQVSEVGRHVGVLACRDVERRSLTKHAQPCEVGGRDRLLEPADVPVRLVASRPTKRLLDRECTVRVDVELGVADCRARRAGSASGSRPELHLHARDALVDPAAELLGEIPLEGVRAEAAAAVHRHPLVTGREEGGDRDVEQTRARSQSAMSTADSAHHASPGRPTLRSAAPQASQTAPSSSVDRPRTTPARTSSTRCAAASAAYVPPSPRVAPERASTSTTVVASHSNVPSDSGASVGIVTRKPKARRPRSPARQELEDLLLERLAHDPACVRVTLAQRVLGAAPARR